jgi:hypothetical protein
MFYLKNDFKYKNFSTFFKFQQNKIILFEFFTFDSEEEFILKILNNIINNFEKTEFIELLNKYEINYILKDTINNEYYSFIFEKMKIVLQNLKQNEKLLNDYYIIVKKYGYFFFSEKYFNKKEIQKFLKDIKNILK